MKEMNEIAYYILIMGIVIIFILSAVDVIKQSNKFKDDV